MNQKYVKATIFFGIALLLCFALFPLWNADNLYDSVIRIHVLANSDSAEDQERKLMVRDAMLEYAEENLKEFDSLKEAKASLRSQLPLMEETAAKVLEEAGCDDSVSVSLSEEYYSTRHYDGFSLPAGQYLSLQVKIGEAQGQNWWCVLFPPLCLSSSVAAEDALVEAGMDEENAKTVTADGTEYEIRFRILDWWSSAKEKLSRIF